MTTFNPHQEHHYYNNNYKTFMAPISLKRIELSGAPSTGVGQTQSVYDAKFINNDHVERKLREDKLV